MKSWLSQRVRNSLERRTLQPTGEAKCVSAMQLAEYSRSQDAGERVARPRSHALSCSRDLASWQDRWCGRGYVEMPYCEGRLVEVLGDTSVQYSVRSSGPPY